MTWKTSTRKSLEQMERVSQKGRHHRIHLNRINEQKLEEKLYNLTEHYEKVFFRLRTERKLEEQRQQMLGITVEQIITQMHSPSVKPGIHSKRSTISSANSSQPMFPYTNLRKNENDRILSERKPSIFTSSSSSSSSSTLQWQNLLSNIEENQSRKEFARTLRNQRYQASRHLTMSRTMARLDEQSRLLHERLADKKQSLHPKQEQSALKQAIKRHLEISAKFCLAAN